MSDTPGREIPKGYREIARHLVSVQGWRYDTSGKGHPVLYPPDRSQPAVRVPTTPSNNPRALKNWIAQIRRAGGIWPPERTP